MPCAARARIGVCVQLVARDWGTPACRGIGMEWQLVQRRRRRGAGENAQLVAELLASLVQGRSGGRPGGAARGPQWRCGACGGCPNDASRSTCRKCGARPAASAAPPAKTKAGTQLSNAPSLQVAPVPGREWPRPPAPEVKAALSASKVAALEAATGLLRDAGLDQEAATLSKPVAQLQKEAEVSLKPGARLDACAAFVARAERRVEAARSATLAAERALEEARAQQGSLEAELAEGRRRLEELRAAQTAAPLAAPQEARFADDFVRDVRALLAGLENGGWVCGASPPQHVLESMRRLHGALAAAAPAPAPTLDTPLEEPAPAPVAATAPAPVADGAAPLADPAGQEGPAADTDTEMDELEAADTDEALVAAARRLKASGRFKLLRSRLKPGSESKDAKARDKRHG